VKCVKPKQRQEMAKAIHPAYWKRQKVKPVRRVWIPAPWKSRATPIRDPHHDGARQASDFTKWPWNQNGKPAFEANSYGFRERHDVVRMPWRLSCLLIQKKPKYVLDADIKGAFDHINQQALLEKLQTYPVMRQIIRSWRNRRGHGWEDLFPNGTRNRRLEG
jgi:RNA-directed DNA polymerase